MTSNLAVAVLERRTSTFGAPDGQYSNASAPRLYNRRLTVYRPSGRTAVMHLFHRRLVLAKVMEGVLRGEHEGNAWPSIKGDRVRSRAATHLLDQTLEHGSSRVVGCYCEKVGHSSAEGQTASRFHLPTIIPMTLSKPQSYLSWLMGMTDYRESTSYSTLIYRVS